MPADAEKVRAKLLSPGDLIFIRVNGNPRFVGACAVVPSGISHLVPSDKMIRVVVDTSVALPAYIAIACAGGSTLASIRSATKTTAGQASISGGDLKTIPIPLPPLAEQRRIAAVVDDHNSRLDAASASIERATIRLKAWESSYLLASTVDHPSVDDWDHVTVGSLAKVSTGATPARHRADYYEDGAIPWVTSSLLNQPTVDNAEQFITEKALNETSVKLFPAGTLLLAMYGEGKTRGRCSELRISATTNQACAAIQLHTESQQWLPWVKLVLDATYDRNRRLASGGVQPNLNLGTVRKIEIPLPDDDVAKCIMTEVDRQRTLGTALREQLGVATNKTAVLHRSLLAAALSGKLVPQDPKDEPASALLERIKSKTTKKNEPRGRPPANSDTAPKQTNLVPSGTQEELPL
ncbi:restriction endonuclease subunit S [Streptomyces sp. NPDC088358]|uniref:restriction endonuclease subunit S n=1 Tax=Streptomyces sp. NPDC088358 TaxID=3365857 RepID=UPI0037F77171